MTLETLLLLVLAHLLADFTLQPDAIARNKARLPHLTLHIVIVGLLTALAIGQWAPWLIGVTVVSHFLIDLIKARLGKDDLPWFAGDQIAHLGVAVALAVTVPIDIGQSFHLGVLAPAAQSLALSGVVYVGGVVLCVTAGQYVMAHCVAPLYGQIDKPIDGLREGGRLIGQLERFLVYLFTVSGNLAGIGFLIAAKSLLRFADISDPNQRKTAEYVIIGTMLSFAWAITVSLATVWLAGRVGAGPFRS